MSLVSWDLVLEQSAAVLLVSLTGVIERDLLLDHTTALRQLPAELRLVLLQLLLAADKRQTHPGQSQLTNQ